MQTEAHIHTDTQPRNSAGWLRITVYQPGPYELTRTLFLQACQAGEIPVTVRKFGPRLWFVNAAEYEAWRNPAVRLTGPADAQRANEINFFE